MLKFRLTRINDGKAFARLIKNESKYLFKNYSNNSKKYILPIRAENSSIENGDETKIDVFWCGSYPNYLFNNFTLLSIGDEFYADINDLGNIINIRKTR
jgi:hypothetical protein